MPACSFRVLWKVAARVASVTLLAAVAFSSSAQSRRTVDWVDWQSGGAGVIGRLSLGGGSVVEVAFSGDYHGAFPDPFPEPYWGPPQTYTGTLFRNAPPNSDAITIGGGSGQYKITFSEPVRDPVLAIASLGLTNAFRTANITTVMQFSVPFEILSNGPNYYAGGQFNPFVRIGNSLFGTEASGVIRFRGTFEEIAWTSPLREETQDRTLIGTYMFTVGSAGCTDFELGPNPLASAAAIPAGCTAYTRGSFAQQAQVDVKGTLRIEGVHRVSSTLEVFPAGRVDNFGQLAVDPAGIVTVRGTMNGGWNVVDGRITSIAGSLWSSNSTLINESGQVRVGGTANFMGSATVLGSLKVDAGGNLNAFSPVTVHGPRAVLDVLAGGRLQAGGSVFLSGGASASIAGTATIGEGSIDVADATLKVLGGGTLNLSAGATIQGTLQNAGTVKVAGGELSFLSGASATNSGQLRVDAGAAMRIGDGVTFQNSGQLQVLGGHVIVDAGGTLAGAGIFRIGSGGKIDVTADAADWRLWGGRLNIDHGGRLEMGLTRKLSTANGARIDNSGVIVLRAAASFENGASYVMQTGSRIEVDAGARVTTGGARFEIAPAADIMGGGIFEQVAGVTILNGSISVPLSYFNGGTLMGSGVVYGTSFLGSVANGGSVLFVRPGNSPGTITFAGDVTMENVVIEIEAFDFDRLDRVVVNGQLNVGRVEARFLFAPDYQPDLNDQGTWLITSNAGGLDNLVVTFPELPAGWELRQSGGLVEMWNASAFRLPEVPNQPLFVSSGEIAYIDTPGYTAGGFMRIEGSFAVKPGATMSSQYGMVITSSGRMTNRGEMRLTGVALVNDGLLENRADGVLRNEVDSIINRGRFVNSGRFENGARVVNEAGAVVEQRGTLANEAYTSFVNRGRIVNSGRIEQADTAFFQNDGGVLHITSTGDFVGGVYEQGGTGAETIVDGLLAVTQAYIRDGLFSGRGTVSGPVAFDNGTIAAPGAIVVRPGGVDAVGRWGGALAFDTTIWFGSGAVIEIMIGGTSESGRLVLSAGAYFDPGAGLRFVLIGEPLAGGDIVVPFLEADLMLLHGFDAVLIANTRVLVRSLAGDDAWIGGRYSIVARADGVDLHLAPVPEPSVHAAMLAGLALVAGVVLRRRSRPATA